MERKEKKKQFPESQTSFKYLQKKKEIWEKKEAVPGVSHQFEALSEIQWKEKKRENNSQNLNAVLSTFRNTMERKEKRKAVPRVSNKFRVLSEINRKEGKRIKQFPESQISFEYF